MLSPLFVIILQIQLSAKESENEKVDRQTLQHQLHKVLKELRKARDQITRLESSVSSEMLLDASRHDHRRFYHVIV